MKKKITYLDKLKEYLKNTPKEQVIKDWEQTKEFEVGPTVEEYLKLIKHDTQTIKRRSINTMIANIKDEVSFRYKGNRFVKGIIDYIDKKVIILILLTDYIGKNEEWYIGESKSFNISEIKKFNNWSNISYESKK